MTIQSNTTAPVTGDAHEKAADWVRNNVLEFTKGMPEVMVGYTLIA